MTSNIEQALLKIFNNREIAVWGFGREGKSSYTLIRRLFPDKVIVIADLQKEAELYFEERPDAGVRLFTADKQMDFVSNCDLVIKSPGIAVQQLPVEICSQTQIFMEILRDQIIGVSGTKGKSTTTSLIHHLLLNAGRKSLITGNIGIPAFDILDMVTEESLIVYELSAHQLCNLKTSPHIAILLNVFQEHLDYFGDFLSYEKAKFNIALHQQENDTFIHWFDQKIPDGLKFKSSIFSYSLTNETADCIVRNGKVFWGGKNELKVSMKRRVCGDHNLLNIMAAVAAVLSTGVPFDTIAAGIESFNGLPHRMEYLGELDGVKYYNDSIATIPEACIQALQTLEKVDTLILGGFDRGIDYSILVDYLKENPVRKILLLGKAGRRIQALISLKTGFEGEAYLFNDFDEAVRFAKANTAKGGICLLSPAASSYDEFKNFEHRGDRFRELLGV